MSTLKVINLVHPSSANNNIVLDSAGNANVVANLNVTGAMSVAGQNFSSVGMKNRIINGDFKIDQRFNGAANNNIHNVAQYVVDRWYYGISGPGANKLRFQQNNTNGPGSAATQVATGFPTYFGANVISSNTVSSTDTNYMAQTIEGLNIADLGWGTANASPVTLSFWCYSSSSGPHGGSLVSGNANRSYPFTYNITTANTWQFQTITIPGDTTGTWWTNNNIGIYVLYPFGIGSSFNGTNNTWNSGSKYPTNIVQPISMANGALYLTGVQLEKGSVATPFEYRPYGHELTLCQRYYTLVCAARPIHASTTAITIPVYGPVWMRANPVITAPYLDANYTSSGTPTGSQWNIQTAGQSAFSKTGTASINASALDPTGGIIYIVGATFSGTGNFISIGGSIPWITLSAEL